MRFLPEIIGFLSLGFALGAQLRLRSFLLMHRRAIVVIVGVCMVLAIAWIFWLQYDGWRVDPISRFLLPPYQGIWYFIGYMAKKLVLPWIAAALAGFAGAALAHRMNAHYGERFFEEEEPWLFGFAIFGVGYPGFLFYVPLLLVVGTFLTIWYAVRNKGRASLYYLWMPTALFVILIKSLVLSTHFLASFSF